MENDLEQVSPIILHTLHCAASLNYAYIEFLSYYCTISFRLMNFYIDAAIYFYKYSYLFIKFIIHEI